MNVHLKRKLKYLMTSSLPDSSGGRRSCHWPWSQSRQSHRVHSEGWSTCSMSGDHQTQITPENDDLVTLCTEVFDEASQPTDKGWDDNIFLPLPWIYPLYNYAWMTHFIDQFSMFCKTLSAKVYLNIRNQRFSF